MQNEQSLSEIAEEEEPRNESEVMEPRGISQLTLGSIERSL